MLSYQHIYHAGNAADVHKHALLCAALHTLKKKNVPLTYLETHAGRGLYDLRTPEALKTKDFMTGVHHLSANADFFPFPLSPDYLRLLRQINHGTLGPFYPGSPWLASQMLPSSCPFHFFEKHPREFKALDQVFSQNPAVTCHFQDGYEGVLSLTLPSSTLPVVLVDPSYEVKDEYDFVARFAADFTHRYPSHVLIVWIPMLPQGRHQPLLDQLQSLFPQLSLHTFQWRLPEQTHGLYGSILATNGLTL